MHENVGQPISAPELIAEAERLTGLADWGEDDFRTPLEALVKSAEAEAGLSAIGYERLRVWLAMRLEQRLRMIEDRKRMPAITAQVIDRPAFIMGLPRAGTTYLHRLMSLHPDMLAASFWQLYLTSPPPNDPTIDHAPQIRRMDEYMEFQGWYSPEMSKVHTHHPEEPEEDIFCFEYSMVSMYFTGYLDVPGYLNYIFSRGFKSAVEWHHRFLQALQYGTRDKRFMLKAPGHSLHVDLLLDTYPDAKMIQNHRDPSKVMASVFSLLTASRRLFSDRTQQVTREQAIEFMERYAEGLAGSARQRADPAFDSKFLDVHYLDLERDPIGCVRKACAHVDVAFTPEHQARIDAWIAENRKGKHGKHRYALADYGLSQDDVHAIFSDYIERFGVEREPGS